MCSGTSLARQPPTHSLIPSPGMLADVLNNLGRLLVPRNKARAWQLGGTGPATGSAGRTFVLGGEPEADSGSTLRLLTRGRLESQSPHNQQNPHPLAHHLVCAPVLGSGARRSHSWLGSQRSLVRLCLVLVTSCASALHRVSDECALTRGWGSPTQARGLGGTQ